MNETTGEALRQHILDSAQNNNQQMAAGSWWHSIPLRDGTVTPGVHPLAELQENYRVLALPADLTGRTLLDIGCWDGFYSFEAERRGARVTSVDRWRPENYFRAHAALESRNEFQQLTVYDVNRARLGSFDIVLFLGVLYHLRHPLLALERVCEVTRDFAVIETHVIDNLLHADQPLMEFYELDQLGGQYDNWWGPNVECLAQLTRAAGFAWVEVLRRSATRATIKAHKRWRDFPTQTAPNFAIVSAQNAVRLTQEYPNAGEDAFIALFVQGLPHHAPRWEVRLEIGGFGARPVYVGAPGDPAQQHLTQINAPIPPGLPLGATTVRVAYEAHATLPFALSLGKGTLW